MAAGPVGRHGHAVHDASGTVAIVGADLVTPTSDEDEGSDDEELAEVIDFPAPSPRKEVRPAA